MKDALSMSLAVACIALVRMTLAQEPLEDKRPIYPFQTAVCPNTLLRACCDFYCPKPQPCICCCSIDRANGCYCGKPQPCIGCFRGPFTSNCYCEKPFPHLCRRIFADYFHCPPKIRGYTQSGQFDSSPLLPTDCPEERVIEAPALPDSPLVD
jgi:hypothetical protein